MGAVAFNVSTVEILLILWFLKEKVKKIIKTTHLRHLSREQESVLLVRHFDLLITVTQNGDGNSANIIHPCAFYRTKDGKSRQWDTNIKSSTKKTLIHSASGPAVEPGCLVGLGGISGRISLQSTTVVGNYCEGWSVYVCFKEQRWHLWTWKHYDLQFLHHKELGSTWRGPD